MRTLVERVWRELCGGDYAEILKSIRIKRSKLIPKCESPNRPELERALRFASLRLAAASTPGIEAGIVLLLLDADFRCVLANREYETWFVAAGESLNELLRLAPGEPPDDPETLRLGKKWIEDRFRGSRYSETIDQPRLTYQMDLTACRCCPSFDKLCRELAREPTRVVGAGP